jgi:hypothetical protein
MPGGIEEAKEAVRLLQQQCCLRMAAVGEEGQYRQGHKSQYGYASFAHRKHLPSGEVIDSSSVCRKNL